MAHIRKRVCDTGQYHKVFNLDKREFLTPHAFGDGLKLGEFASGYQSGTMAALGILLACSAGQGMGDMVDREDPDYHDNPNPQHDYVGRWAGDRVAIVGDYAEDSDMPNYPGAGKLYDKTSSVNPDPAWRDISDDVRPLVEIMMQVQIVGEGWRDRVREVEVPSKTTPGEVYKLQVGETGAVACSCPAYKYRHENDPRYHCKHMKEWDYKNVKE